MSNADRNQGDPKMSSPYRAVVGEETRVVRKHFAAAADRNTPPILEVLRDAVPATGRALEIAGGTGQHTTAFAAAFPGMHWQPSDRDGDARESINEWISYSGLANTAPPLALDVSEETWDAAVEPGLDLIVCINMIHVSRWAACAGLLRGAGRLLGADGLLYLYGPYKRDGRHTAPSNEAFDRSLRSSNPEWGIRDLADVTAAAAAQGLVLDKIVEMPANNLSVLFRRTAG